MTPPDANISGRKRGGLADNIIEANDLAGMARIAMSPNADTRKRDVMRTFIGNSIDLTQRSRISKETPKSDADTFFFQTMSNKSERPFSMLTP